MERRGFSRSAARCIARLIRHIRVDSELSPFPQDGWVQRKIPRELKQWIAHPDFHADLLPIVADGEPLKDNRRNRVTAAFTNNFRQ